MMGGSSEGVEWGLAKGCKECIVNGHLSVRGMEGAHNSEGGKVCFKMHFRQNKLFLTISNEPKLVLRLGHICLSVCYQDGSDL